MALSLAELISGFEDEWEQLDPIRPGRCFYVAQRLREQVREGNRPVAQALGLIPAPWYAPGAYVVRDGGDE